MTVGIVDDHAATILHVDMDAFFASVELLDRPDARGKPAIVGNLSGRSVVTSATYEARRFGVRSAMPVSQALRLCPHAIVLPPHHEKYAHYSRRVMAIFRDVTPIVEPLSIDEAFLDVSGARMLFGSPRTIAENLRQRVYSETKLTCSIGVAGTKFMAKLASSRAKPNGLLVIPPAQTRDYLQGLPIEALWGVGSRTQERLRRLGLTSVGDLAACPETTLQHALGDAAATRLHDLANGIDPRPVWSESREKSIGHETTFTSDVRCKDDLRREILRLSRKVGERLRRSDCAARTISIKVRFADFRTITRSRTIPEATNVGRRLFDVAMELEESVKINLEDSPVRLIGVRAEQLVNQTVTAAALWDPDAEWRDADRTVDQVASRFGSEIIRPASLLTHSRETAATSIPRASSERGRD